MNKKKWILIIGFILCILYIRQNWKWSKTNLFSSSVEVGEARMAVNTMQGNFYIVDQSSSRILKVNDKGQLCGYISGGSSAEEFCYAVSIQPAEDGGFYLLDYLKDEDRVWYTGEVIRKFSADGKQEEIVYQTDYVNEKRTGITKIILNKDGVIHSVKSDSTGINLINLENTRDSIRYDFKDADRMIKDYTIEPKTGVLYFLTEHGEIGYFDKESKERRIIFKNNWEEEKRILSAVSFSGNGQLYLTDTLNQEICMLNDGKIKSFLKKDDYFYDIRVWNGFIVCGNKGIYQIQGDTIVYNDTFPLSGSLLTQKIFFITAFVYAVLFLTGSLVFVLRYIQKKGTPILQGSVIFLFGILTITTVFSMITMKNVKERFTEEMMLRAQTAADIIARNIPVRPFQALDRPEAFLTEDYDKVKEAVTKGFTSSFGGISDMYCVLYSIEEDKVWERFRLEEDHGCAYVCPWQPEDELEILKTKEAKQYERVATSEGIFIFVLVPIFDGNGNACGIIEVGKNVESFDKENRELIAELYINIIALAAVIFMIVLEALIYFQARKEYRTRKLKTKGAEVPVTVWRMIVFLIFFITNIPTGFLAIMATKMAENMEGYQIAPSVLAAVPISAEVLTGAVFSIYGNRVIRAVGQRRAGFIGAFLFLAGLFTRFLYQNLWVLALGSAIQGCGWGILLLIVNISIAREDGEEKREEGFTGYSTACQNGVNAGVVFGGFLLYWLNYRQVFFISTLLGLFVFWFVKVYFMDSRTAAEEDEKAGMPVWKFVLSPRVFIYFIGIVLPIVSAGYYLNYLYPVIGSEYGISESNIGYSYLINGLCIMLFGNVLTKYLTKRFSRKQVIILSSAIYAGAFILAGTVSGIPVLLLTMGLLGLADSFGGPVQSAYFAELPEVKAYGYDRSIGILGLVENLAETIGPFIFGYVLVAGLTKGLIFMAVIILTLAVLFGLVGIHTKRLHAKKVHVKN